MKKVLILITVIGVIFLAGMGKSDKSVLSVEQTAAIKAAVLESHQEMIVALEKLDVDKFFESIIDSGMGTIIQNGKVLTRQEVLDSMRRGFEGITTLKYEFNQKIVKVLSPQTAIFVGQGKSTVTRDTGGVFNNDFAVTNVFILKDGKWKVAHGHHSIPNPRP